MLDCSGHGTCNCGQCECDAGYGGDLCQCDNTNCRVDVNNNMCSGHGACDCGTCKCSEGWEGPDCGCSTSKEMCLNRDTKKECSGHGKCECGVCK